MTFPASSPQSPGRHHMPGSQAGYGPSDRNYGSGQGWPGQQPTPPPQDTGHDPWRHTPAAPPPDGPWHDSHAAAGAPRQEPLPNPAAAAGGSSTWRNPAEGPSKDELAWADVRRQVAARLKSINSTQCYEAFDRFRTKNALSPHGVVLFFALNDPAEPLGYRLQFLVRMFLAGPESDSLPHILVELTRSVEANIARARTRRRRWHPRGPEDSIVNGGNMDLPDEATYVGAGVSTLDTDELSWNNAARAIFNQPLTVARPRTVFDLPGRGIVMLTDGTNMRVVRDPDRRIGDEGITSNKSLDPARTRYWNPHTDVTQQGDPTLRGAWTQLAPLHHTLHTYLNGEPSR